jgi:hypothetical protein
MTKRPQLNMAVPPEVLAQLKELAAKQGVSVSALALRAIRQLLEAEAEGLSIEERLRKLEEQVRELKG